MKTVLSVIVVMISFEASGAVHEGSLYPEDALLISDTVQEHYDGELMVNLAGTDSSLVLFVALGCEWTGDTEQWNELMIVSSCAASIDLQRSWSIRDIAVSFGSSWCRLHMDELLEITDEELGESEFLERFQAITEIYPMNNGDDN
ncbi:hypothetical protein DRQ25_06005 [Candidatus Fermentibacteria bacterium]|nr:MAG: hypothetical protein DRQ25_06005 [Candidatus Fermentibacteria bacterium]